MAGDGHDGAGAVADEDVVGDPNGDLLAVDGIDGVGAGEDAGFFLGQSVRSRSDFLATRPGSFDGGALLGSGDYIHEPVLGERTM